MTQRLTFPGSKVNQKQTDPRSRVVAVGVAVGVAVAKITEKLTGKDKPAAPKPDSHNTGKPKTKPHGHQKQAPRPPN